MANEIAISRLYRQFAESFPEDSTFWTAISSEELVHASWIEKLLDVEQKGEIGPGSTTIQTVAVDNSIRYIDSLSEKCRQGGITRINAFALAHDIETSLLEKNFLSVFALGTGPFRDLHDKLVADTKQHARKIGSALASMKSHPNG